MRPDRAYAPAARASDAPASHPPDSSRVLVIGCGALARELVAVIDQAGLANVDLTCLPATLHNRPGGIPAAVRAKIRAARFRYERIFIAYADCGTGGLLDKVLADEGVERLPGAHCYEVYSGARAFATMTDEDPATFFLTDFLARNFDRLVIRGLGLDRHPELLPVYFGNYRRLVYLAQTDDPALLVAARRAARRLGLAFELRRTGYGELATSVAAACRSGARNHARSRPVDPRAPSVALTPGDAFAPSVALKPGDALAPSVAPTAIVALAPGDAFAPSVALTPGDPLAPDASNVARQPTVGAESIDSSQSMQASDANAQPRDRALRTMQEGGASRGGERHSLRPTQARIGRLQRMQGSATPAGIRSPARPNAPRTTPPRTRPPRPTAPPALPRTTTAPPALPRSIV